MSVAPGQSYHVLATYYEQLSETRDWAAWIAYVNAVLQDAYEGHPKRVLDAACGTGRVAVGLASLGYEVTGVDVSESMLHQARQKSEQFGLAMKLYHQDLRSMSLDTQFPAAISLCDSLNYITDQADFELAIRNVADHLEPGGLFLFDVNTDWKLRMMYGDHTYAEHHDGFSLIWENDYDEKAKTVTMELAFFIKNDDGLYHRYDEVHVQRAYSHLEVLESLAKAGLELVGWGDPGGFTPPESQEERTFYLAAKPKNDDRATHNK